MRLARQIFVTYISPSTGGPGLIYTSEAQRKTLAGKMKRLWRKKPRKGEGREQGEPDSLANNDGGALDDESVRVEPPPKAGSSALSDVQKDRDAGDEQSGDQRLDNGGDGGSHPSPRDGVADLLEMIDDQCSDDERDRLPSEESLALSHRYSSATESDSDCVKEREEASRALSLSLFDEIMDQNAIPTIRQNSEFCLLNFDCHCLSSAALPPGRV